MERLTYKNYIEEYEVNFEKSSDKNWSIAESDTHIKVTGEPINKLGELEDVLEEFELTSAEDLRNHLNFQDNMAIWEGKLELKNKIADLEQELAESESKRKSLEEKLDEAQNPKEIRFNGFVVDCNYDEARKVLQEDILKMWEENKKLKESEELSNYAKCILKNKKLEEDLELSEQEIQELKQQLAEKDKEISNLNGLVRERDKQKAIVPKFKIGKTLYMIPTQSNGLSKIKDYILLSVSLSDIGIRYDLSLKEKEKGIEPFYCASEDMFDKSIFATKEEAEQKLAKAIRNNNQEEKKHD